MYIKPPKKLPKQLFIFKGTKRELDILLRTEKPLNIAGINQATK